MANISIRNGFRASRRAACLAVVLMAGANPGTAGAESNATARPSVLETPVQALAGPKRTVAVSRFVMQPTFTAQPGFPDLGTGLSALLTAALLESGQFIVVERAGLDAVLYEQQLGATGSSAREGAPVTGNLLGAALLIQGTVTELHEGPAGSVGLGLPGFGVALQNKKAIVALAIQIVDSTTGQVVASYDVREAASSRSVSVDLAGLGPDTSVSQLLQTTIGQAAKKAITKAVHRFAAEAASRPWTGRIVSFDDGEIVLNAGRSSGIRAGDMFAIERVGTTFVDPATGRVIGSRRATLGRLVVTDVDDEVAFGRFEAAGDAAPSRGDFVVMK